MILSDSAALRWLCRGIYCSFRFEQTTFYYLLRMWGLFLPGFDQPPHHSSMTRPAPPDPTFTLRGCDGPVTALSFMSGGGGDTYLLSGTQHGTVSTWNLTLRRMKHSFQAHSQQSVLWLKPFGDADDVLSHGRDGLVCRWKCAGSCWQKVDSFHAASLGFCPACVFRLEQKSVLALPANSSSAVDVVAMDTKTKIFTLTPPDNHGMCMHITFTAFNEIPHLLIAYENGSIVLWNLIQGTMVSKLDAHADSVMCVDYCSILNKGVSGSVDDKLCTWQISSDLTLVKLKDIEITNPGLNCIQFRKDGKLFATAGWDSHIRLFTGKKGSPLAVLQAHKASIQSLTFAEDNTLVAGSKDCTISFWDVYK